MKRAKGETLTEIMAVSSEDREIQNTWGNVRLTQEATTDATP
jgi:hypothetical protein